MNLCKFTGVPLSLRETRNGSKHRRHHHQPRAISSVCIMESSSGAHVAQHAGLTASKRAPRRDLCELVLLRPPLRTDAQRVRRAQWPLWVTQERARKQHEVRLASCDDLLSLSGVRDHAHGTRCNASLLADG